MSDKAIPRISLWHETAGDDLTPRPSLALASQADRSVDVGIVGAGYTGLWTAYYLKLADPSLRIAILDSEVAGFGASGRNGGWCSALYPVSLSALSREHGRDAAVRQYRAMQATVREVGKVIARDGLAVDWAPGGTITLARTTPQMKRVAEEIDEHREFGFDASDVELVTADAASGHLNATSVLGGMYTPHCAVIHPAKLVRSLARRVESLGVRIYEQTPVTAIEPGRASTDQGELRAAVLISRDRGFHPCAARAQARDRAGVLADDRHRTATSGTVGRHRFARPRNLRRLQASRHLRTAHRR